MTAKVADAAATGSEQAQVREQFWSLVDQAHATGDLKQTTRDPTWRAEICQAHAALYQTASKPDDVRRIRSAARMILSQFTDRAQMCLNPACVTQVMGPTIEQDLIPKQDAQFLVTLTQKRLSRLVSRRISRLRRTSTGPAAGQHRRARESADSSRFLLQTRQSCQTAHFG